MSLICINKQMRIKQETSMRQNTESCNNFNIRCMRLSFYLELSFHFFVFRFRFRLLLNVVCRFQVNHATSGISRFLSFRHISPIIFSNKKFTKIQTNSICFLLVFDFCINFRHSLYTNWVNDMLHDAIGNIDSMLLFLLFFLCFVPVSDPVWTLSLESSFGIIFERFATFGVEYSIISVSKARTRAHQYWLHF